MRQLETIAAIPTRGESGFCNPHYPVKVEFGGGVTITLPNGLTGRAAADVYIEREENRWIIRITPEAENGGDHKARIAVLDGGEVIGGVV